MYQIQQDGGISDVCKRGRRNEVRRGRIHSSFSRAPGPDARNPAKKSSSHFFATNQAESRNRATLSSSRLAFIRPFSNATIFFATLFLDVASHESNQASFVRDSLLFQLFFGSKHLSRLLTFEGTYVDHISLSLLGLHTNRMATFNIRIVRDIPDYCYFEISAFTKSEHATFREGV